MISFDTLHSWVKNEVRGMPWSLQLGANETYNCGPRSPASSLPWSSQRQWTFAWQLFFQNKTVVKVGYSLSGSGDTDHLKSIGSRDTCTLSCIKWLNTFKPKDKGHIFIWTFSLFNIFIVNIMWH